MSNLIYRQVAISAICNACGKIDCDKMDKCEKLQLPPANNSEIPNSSDTISRQAAISALKNDMASLDHIIKGMSANDVRLDAYVSQRNQVNYDIYTINNLPPAQPEQLSTNLAEVGTDCISRQAAIETVMECYDNDELFEVYEDKLRELPPAQPEPHWIPVTEATPTEDDDYWATFEAETGRFVDWASWYQGRWVVWIEGSPAHLSNVIAWCKPIEPYKGVTE